jgi:hypothetical protein
MPAPVKNPRRDGESGCSGLGLDRRLRATVVAPRSPRLWNFEEAILERYGSVATIIASQRPVTDWHEYLARTRVTSPAEECHRRCPARGPFND